MEFFKRLIDLVTLGSDRPIRRLIAYYVVLTVVLLLIFHFLPSAGDLIKGDQPRPLTTTTSSPLQDEVTTKGKEKAGKVPIEAGDLAPQTIIVMLSTLALMLPVSWVFMSARRARGFSQSIAQTLIILPIVVAGIVLVVRTSLALAFSLGGIVAGLRFRATMRDTRDQVYIFLGIAVGLAVGVQSLIVAAVLSVTFNFAVLLIWRLDFGGRALSRAWRRSGRNRWATWPNEGRTTVCRIATWCSPFLPGKLRISPSDSAACTGCSARRSTSRASTRS